MRENHDDRVGPKPDTASADPSLRRRYARRVECSEPADTPPRDSARASRGAGVRDPEPPRDDACGDAR